MNIEKIKNLIELYKGKTINFCFNGSRNQIEEFFGTIVATYPSIFTVEVKDNKIVKSFTYSDVLIHKLVIKEQ